MQQLDLGQAELAPPTQIVAGGYETVVYRYTAGHPIDDSGYLKIAFRFAGDFGAPQFADPAAPNYCTVSTTGNCTILPRWDRKGNTRPWGQSLHLKVTSGFLDRGECITVVFGDIHGGSPGWQVQTFCEDTFEFKTLVDPIATYEFKELPVSPTLHIIAGTPAQAVCIAPSLIVTGTPFPYYLKLEDRWGNPLGDPAQFEHAGWTETGIQRIAASCPRCGLSATSNPIEVVSVLPDRQRFWADFHGQSEETIGSNTIDDYFTFARDVALLDAAGHQGNDFQITDQFWETVNRTAEEYNSPDSFVTFPGYEWSGNSPLGGDRNVYFTATGGIIGHSCVDLLPGKQSAHPTCSTADALFGHLKAQDGAPAFVFAHVGGRYADLRMHDEDLEWAVEIHSAWGTFEWLLEDAFRLGYRVGVVANSDGHKGRPGASYPGAKAFGSYGGLTCVLAPTLDQAAIATALKARHCYATTGQRCLLTAELYDDTGAIGMMGDVLESWQGQLSLQVHGEGTGAVERLEIRNGLDTFHTHQPAVNKPTGRRVKVLWEGAEVRGRARKVVWDGQLQVTGKQIEAVTPVNFWNVDWQPERTGDCGIRWHSITTGGSAGLIVTLKQEADSGQIAINTAQGSAVFNLAQLGPEGARKCFGGLGKILSICRLPDEDAMDSSYTVKVPLNSLHSGDNPIYVRVVQEDGHMAWSSPIYIVKQG